MKTKSHLAIAALLGMILSTPRTSLAFESCLNCSAEVVIKRESAENFRDVLSLISSMPLYGEISEIDNVAETSTVVVSTYKEYAESNKVTSFDVAQRLVDFAEGHPIIEIRAVFRPGSRSTDSKSVSNVGTIGHK